MFCLLATEQKYYEGSQVDHFKQQIPFLHTIFIVKLLVPKNLLYNLKKMWSLETKFGHMVA